MRQENPKREPGWGFSHGLRVANCALALAKEVSLPVNEDIVYIGALCHDIGRGHNPHNERGAQVTAQILQDHCTPEELRCICHIVLHHIHRTLDNLTAELKLVQDADLLDKFGKIIVWRAVYFCGRQHQEFSDLMAYVHHEYRLKLVKKLHFEQSKKIYTERRRFENEFFGELERLYIEGI